MQLVQFLNDELYRMSLITMLKSAFEVPVFLVGDFNETLHPSERSSGYLNVNGSKAFKSFLSNRDFIEYPLWASLYMVLGKINEQNRQNFCLSILSLRISFTVFD